MRNVVLPERETVIEDRAPAKEELKYVLQYVKIREKALIRLLLRAG